jgi:uncharacterized PurR-regulated membrane protein YhhQ (DUF165 family)
MQQHWLTRPRTIRVLWIGFVIVLGFTVVAEFFVHRHPHFSMDGLLAFNAIYGFLACVALILIAKLLGFAIKRPETYYAQEHDD